jgi:medium-chain acyl-[acyl-carrier-protein] hydrolase
LRCGNRKPAPGVRLFCFPHAGGPASAFFPWWKSSPDEIEVWGVQLPGREDRLREPCLRRMAAVVDALLSAIEPLLDKPWAFFGYSMGALVAFELSRRLRAGKGLLPRHLFVAARAAPQLAQPLPPLYTLAEADFIRQLQVRHQGLPDVIVNNAELRAIFLPILRADLELTETYVPSPEEPLCCPITAIGGRDDIIPELALAAWAEHTTARFRVCLVAGGHFFLKTAPAEVLRIVAEELNGAQ